MKNLVIATHNPGKILEYKEIFAELKLPFKLLTLSDIGVHDEAEESGKSFEENAVKKAEFYARFSDWPILAEDSGLEIDYLKGEPGVLSRRWPGHHATDEELIWLALEKLKGVPWERRGAQLRVVMALKFSPMAAPALAEGILRGYITEKPLAPVIPGFPYRSLFYVESLGKVLGELSMAEEASIAHRRQALLKLKPVLQNLL